MADIATSEGTTAQQPGIPGNWTTRFYREGDIPAIIALMDAADPVDKADQTLSAEELENNYSMPGSHPEWQVVLIEGSLQGVPARVPLGYGRIVSLDDEEGQERIYQFRVVAHPAAKAHGMEKVVFARLVEVARAHERKPDTKAMSKVSLLTMPREESTVRTMLDEVGMRQIRQAWMMERSLDESLPEPAAVEGVTFRHYSKPDDHVPAREAYDNSFIDHFEYHPFPQEMWNFQIEKPETRADLSWLAEANEEPGKIAGFCICEMKAKELEAGGNREGWIALLGTVRGWRGKGLGKSLLLRGMRSLKEAGAATALLGVDSESLTGANRLYESVGFRVRSHEILYKQSLDDIQL